MKSGIESFCTEIYDIIDKLDGNIIEYQETINRKTWYLDTSKKELQKNNYVLRIREESGLNKKYKITLKYRNEDRYISASKDIAALKKFKHKFEEDILPDYIIKYSHSVTINKKKLSQINNMNDAIELFPCLEEIRINKNSDLISPNDFIAHETTHWIGAFDFENNDGNIKACLNFWHNSARRKGTPMISEFSFDYDSLEVNENELERFKLINVYKANELFLKLQKTNSWIDPSLSKTKTQLAYNVI